MNKGAPPTRWDRTVSMKTMTGIAGRSGENFTLLQIMNIAISRTKRNASEGEPVFLPSYREKNEVYLVFFVRE